MDLHFAHIFSDTENTLKIGSYLDSFARYAYNYKIKIHWFFLLLSIFKKNILQYAKIIK